MKRRTRLWWLAGAVVLTAVVVLAVAAPQSSLFGVAVALLWLWVAVGVAALLWGLWRWLTYRVSVRLLISYVLLSVMPFLICAVLGGVVLYMAMGQYTSVRFGGTVERLQADLERDCREVADAFAASGAAAASAAFADAVEQPRFLVPRVLWRARLGGASMVGPGAGDVPDPGWIDGPTATVARSGEHLYVLVAVAGADGGWVAALVPLDNDTARALSRELWFDVLFASLEDGDESLSVEARVGESAGGPTGADERRVRTNLFDGTSMRFEDAWESWSDDRGGLLSRPLVYWFRLTVDVLDLATGEPAPSAISLLRTSPLRVWDDFTRSRYELGSHLWGVVTGMALFLLVLYAFALIIAATMIVSITRSTARLSRGARAVEEGHLDHRIPVKRRDQLGDLALSFNRMTESVQNMLGDVAENERMARELELAREIQESLLPDRHLHHGSLAVHAVFRPAAAVGGDYFDVFPVDDRRLLVVVGDVAGHGLHAGLLMASLKSMVAALIREGYSGEGLLAGVNSLLAERRSGPTMATLAVIEIDLSAGRLTITNAGHPPAYLISNGRPEELMAGSLPLGSMQGRPAKIERPFGPGDRLLVYSDGLVEALGPEGEPFGYDRLEATVRQAAELPAGELELAVLGALDRFAGARPLADDLTLLLVERAAGPETAEPTV